MNLFEKYLSIWVGISILMGIILGNSLPSLFTTIASFELHNVNFVIAVLIWAMIFPMLLNVDFSCMKNVKSNLNGIYLTVFINWFVKPFTMAGIGYLFFKIIFADYITSNEADEFLAGVILLGIAPCTAMVFLWSRLVNGDANYTLVQVSVNDVILIILFPFLTKLLLEITDLTVPWFTLILSVTLYIVIPLLIAFIVRNYYLRNNSQKIENFSSKFKIYSIAGLLLTVVVLFGFQAHKIISNPFIILLISIPLLIQTYGIYFITYLLAFRLSIPYNIAAPAALIGTSNFFELAVAVAISLFGLNSGAALATVVGVLVEVPVMLSLVAISNRTKSYFGDLNGNS